MPPTGRTLPRSVISPVIATSLRTGISVTAEKSDIAMVIPAEGPSLGIAPSGTWIWMSNFSWKSAVGVVHLRPAADVRDRGARRLLHDVAERAGQRQVALALHEARLDHQDLAADLGPGQARRDPDLEVSPLRRLRNRVLPRNSLRFFGRRP